jgi:hypothetical protein
MPSGDKRPGTGTLLVGDAALVYLLLNATRHRVVERLFRVSRNDSNLVTVIAIGSLAGAVGAGAARVRSVQVRPSLADAAIGAAVVNETAHGIAGAWSRQMPFFSALIAFVLLEKSFRPAVRGSIRSVRGSVRGVMGSIRSVRSFLEGE